MTKHGIQVGITTGLRIEEITIETPLGPVLFERVLFEDGSDEFYAVYQDLSPDFSQFESNGAVLGHFVKQYAIAYSLVERGYEYGSQPDETTIAWRKDRNV